jgi:hypothetical protein
MKKTGYIYVITNRAMPGIVKIGYSEDVNKRLNSLYSSNVPFPFELYATVEGVTQDADKLIHKMLPSSLRVNDSREFFNITPEYAYDILFQIAKVFGVTNRLKKWDESSTEDDGEDSDVGLKPRHLNRMGFWKTFNDVSSKMNSQIGQLSKKAMTHNWCYFSTGGGHCHIEVALNNTKHYVSVYYFTTSHDVYNKMNSATAKIENICGKKLTWNISNTQKRFSATLGVKIPGLDFNNSGNYPDLAKQTIETVEAMKQAYQKVILHSKGN